jgi:hypothetical protein
MGGDTDDRSGAEWFDAAELDSDSQASGNFADAQDVPGTVDDDEPGRPQQVLLVFSSDGFQPTDGSIHIPVTATFHVKPGLADSKPTITMACSPATLAVVLEVMGLTSRTWVLFQWSSCMYCLVLTSQ